MTRVPWDQLSPDLYEDMVAVLLSHLHPGAQRIDGRGGDGGRDVQFPDGDALDGFELKSFTGRLERTQRRQVERSLARASGLGLRRWTLVLPIDPTPGELRWFDGLRAGAPFPLEWSGKTWLDAEFARRWYIARYFIEGREHEAIELLREINEAEAAMAASDVPTMADHVGRLVARANDLDPYYRFEIQSNGARTSIRIVPRYVGATQDRPIRMNATFVFPKTEEGKLAEAQFEEALDFGTPVTLTSDYVKDVTIDAPAGLGGEFPTSELVMRGAVREGVTDIEASLAIVGPDGVTISQIPLSFTLESGGRRGAIFNAQHRSGVLSVRMRMDTKEREFRFTLQIHGDLPYYPHELLPLGRFLLAAVTPNRMVIRSSADGDMGSAAIEFSDPWLTAEFVDLVADLALIQAQCGVTQLVRPSLSAEDVMMIRRGATLARGEAVTDTWTKLTATIGPADVEDFRKRVLADQLPFAFVTPEPQLVTVQETEYRLGSETTRELTSARLSDPDHEAWARSAPTVGSKVTLVPAGDNRVNTRIR